MYYIPIDQLQPLHHMLYTHNLIEVKEEVQIMNEAKPGLVLDLFHTIVFVAIDQLPLTTKGIVHKKSIQKLIERLNLKEEDLNELPLQITDAEHVPLQVAIILDLLYYLKLVTKEPKQIVVQEKSLNMWLNMNTEQMTSVIVEIIIERYGAYHPEMQHWCCLIRQPVFLSGQWVEVERLLDWMIQEQMVNSSQRDEMRIRAKAWLRALAGFGWVDVGMVSGDRICFRWSISADIVLNVFHDDRWDFSTSDDAITSRYYVQPDFDIIVLPDVPYVLRWKLMMFTDIGKSDRMSIYRLTKESITRAVKRGVRIDEILNFMAEYSETGVPEHISLTLRQWDKDTNHSEIISSSSGIETRMDYFSEQQVKETWDVRKNFIKEIAPVHLVHIENDMPLPESFFPGIEQIPMMWTREFRSYHFSTGLQMMEQALLWKTKVKVSLGAQEVDFIPLHVTHNPYVISGEVYNPVMMQYERIQLSPSDWKELRLIVPNFT
ncbi:helicase-associated domain-containing protein [Paenibacillus antarcticus]|uniref:helicase-associated domain-containing protein n=1 Tax=Paenibacillus antarcticus TaxID=253703 RepID=UPI00165E6CF9|nr:helicase-associated domain-containing protein [Paenibacillus antarcticus]